MAVIRWSPLVSNETNDSRDAPVGEYSFAAATYVFMVSGILVWTAALRVSPVLAIYATALLFGWSEGNGLCGTSHVCCLTPLRVLDPSGNLWLRSVSAYTLAGIPTAAFVGALLGVIGDLASLSSPRVLPYALAGIFWLALLLAVREARWLSFPLPQVRRQTDKGWAHEFGFVTGAAMWGSHIGLGVATVVAHGGFYVLVACALIFGPLKGGLLLATYWIARTLPAWSAPLLTSNQGDGVRLGDHISANPRAFRSIAAAGLLCAAAAVALLFLRGVPL